MGRLGRNKYREPPRVPAGQDRGSSPLPALGQLEMVRAWVNTLQARSGGDELATPKDLSTWLARQSLLPTGTPLSQADLERARQVRAGLRAVMRSHGGGELDEAAVSRLDEAVIGARAQVRFERDGTTRLELISRDFDGALGTLLAIVHAARLDDTWPALKLCHHPDCQRAFFDYTKSRNGRWCTRRCGNKIRATAHRRKKGIRGR